MLNDPSRSCDERYDVLFEHIQAIEKNFEKRYEQLAPPTITISGTKSYLPKRLNGVCFGKILTEKFIIFNIFYFKIKELRGEDQDKFRRSIKRTQRDHRKTHVIRPEDTIAARAELPEFDPKLLLCNITNSAVCKSDMVSPNANLEKSKAFASAIPYLSPYGSSPATPYIATPADDKSKDPDWGPSDDGPDWAKTPLGFKTRRSKQSLTKNVIF